MSALNVGGDDLIPLAIAHLEANGYAVIRKDLPVEPDRSIENYHRKHSRRKAKASKVEEETPALNAVGKPYGENYRPNYRMKYRAGSTARLFKPYSDAFRSHLT